MVFVSEKPGIGKTSLIRAAASDAVAQGARVAWGTCIDVDGAPGYWPWTQALDGLVRDIGVHIACEAGEDAAVLASIVPSFGLPWHGEASAGAALRPHLLAPHRPGPAAVRRVGLDSVGQQGRSRFDLARLQSLLLLCTSALLFMPSCVNGDERLATTPPRCASRGPSEVAPSAMERSSIRADVDGDGRLDLTAIYTVPSGRTVENLDQPGTEIDPDPTERIRVETADGSVLDEELFFSGAGLRPAAEVWAATDANGDGRAEVWVNPHDGATGHSLRLVVFADCRPRQVRRAGESGPAEFVHDVTGSSSAAFSFGIECVDMDGDGPAEVVTTEEERLHGSVRWHFVAYRLQSDVVHVVQEQEVTSPPSTPDTRLRWEGQGLRCPLVAHPAGQGLR